MDLDERYQMNEEGKHKECKCDVCGKWVDEFDVDFIEDLQVCIACDDLAYLRLEGFLRGASEITRQLVA